MAGRWSRLPERDLDPTRRAAALAELLLERYGVVTRGAVVAEESPGGFAAVYPVLSAFEEAGRCRRGYFVEGLGAAQFAVPGAVDRLRAQPRRPGGARRGLVLAATDPANPYGAALPWPERPATPSDGPRAGWPPPRPQGRRRGRPGRRRPGALRRARRPDRCCRSRATPARWPRPAEALAHAVRDGALGSLAVERVDGEAVLSSPLTEALAASGFRATPRGLRLRR